MSRKLLSSTIFLLAVCTNNLFCQSSLQYRDSIGEMEHANIRAGLWPTILAITAALLVLTYILIKAINKRTSHKP